MQASWIVGLALVGCDFEPGELLDARTDASEDDADGDGVLDVIDNCPAAANVEQRDHDADKHGDACDRCPHLASETDPDGDGDGVGDACDPRPQAAGERRVVWEPFNDASSIAGWTTIGAGNWAVSNGALTQTLLGQDTVLEAPGMLQRPYVATRIVVSSLGPVAWLGLRTGVVTGRYFACLMQPGPSILATSFVSGVQNNNAQTPWAGSLAAGASVDLVETHTSDNRCTATQASIVGVASTPVSGARNGAFQLYSRDAAAAFDYLFVVEIGP